MRSRVVHVSFIAMFIGFVSLAAVVKTYSVSGGQLQDIITWSFTEQEFARVCIASPGKALAGSDDRVLTSLVSFETQSGERIMERTLRIPVGAFRCTDVTPEQLVAAGAVPEPTGRVNFLLIASAFTDVDTSAINPGQQLPVGSIETIERETGQTRIYGGIHWAFDNHR